MRELNVMETEQVSGANLESAVASAIYGGLAGGDEGAIIGGSHGGDGGGILGIGSIGQLVGRVGGGLIGLVSGSIGGFVMGWDDPGTVKKLVTDWVTETSKKTSH